MANNEDFRMRYQSTLADIDSIKGRQWAATYYILLLFGAIIGFCSALGGQKSHTYVLQAFPWMRWSLLFISIAIGVAGTFILIEFYERLKEYRERLWNCVDHLSDELRDFDRMGQKPPSQRKDVKWYTGFFISMLWAGVVFVSFFLFFPGF
jgi:hypothetical protein